MGDEAFLREQLKEVRKERDEAEARIKELEAKIARMRKKHGESTELLYAAVAGRGRS